MADDDELVGCLDQVISASAHLGLKVPAPDFSVNPGQRTSYNGTPLGRPAAEQLVNPALALFNLHVCKLTRHG
jgi:hypothetical protein